MAAVAVLHGRLDPAEAVVERLAALLSPEEREHAERFRFARDRRRFIVRRGRLRECLAVETGTAPEELIFFAEPYGKPALDAGPHFSLSHSGDHWALAIAGVPVGIDIERMDPAIDHKDIAGGLFGPGECAALASLSPDHAMRGFFDCWARKEAFVKAIGQGLSYPLDAFEVSVVGPARLRSGGDGWVMRAITVAPDVAGALVACDDDRPLVATLRDFDALQAVA